MIKIYIILLAVIIVGIIICLSTAHPLLRDVEPQVITYSIYGINTEDEKHVFTAVETAFTSWEHVNPELAFEYGDGGMMIIFTEYLGDAVSGTAMCPFWSNSENGCIILVSHDAITFEHHLTNTIMHETGHVLGLGHIDNTNHLMIGPLHWWLHGNDMEFDSGGYIIPKMFKWGDL